MPTKPVPPVTRTRGFVLLSVILSRFRVQRSCFVGWVVLLKSPIFCVEKSYLAGMQDVSIGLSPKSNVQSVQIMRGVASLLVVFLHISIKGGQYGNGALRGFVVGGSGVDLFFIISGYIMCYSTADRKMNGYQFLLHRFQRIMPLYWFTTLVALAVFLYNPKIVNTSGGETSIWASFVLFPNGKKFLNSIGWTLSFEFFYYLIFACFIGRGTDKAIRWSSLILLVLVVLGWCFNPYAPLLFFVTNILFLEFVFGMGCFYFFNRKGVRMNGVLAVALCLAGVGILVLEQVFPFPGEEGLRGLCWGIPMLFIFIGLLSLEEVIQRGKSFIKAGLLEIGNASYSLYLSHTFVLSGTAMCLRRLGMAGNPWLFTAVLLVAAVVIGQLVYLYIERPMTSFVRRAFASQLRSDGKNTGKAY